MSRCPEGRDTELQGKLGNNTGAGGHGHLQLLIRFPVGVLLGRGGWVLYIQGVALIIHGAWDPMTACIFVKGSYEFFKFESVENSPAPV